MPILSLNSVSKCFGALKVTDNVSFDVPQGQALGIIGDVLQDMVAENDIKAVVLERDMMQVKVHVR